MVLTLRAEFSATRTLLILFANGLKVCLAVWIEGLLAALRPCGFELRRRDVPVRPAFHADGTQILAQLFDSRPSEEPVAVVDLIDDKTRLEDDHVGGQGIVGGR